MANKITDLETKGPPAAAANVEPVGPSITLAFWVIAAFYLVCLLALGLTFLARRGLSYIGVDAPVLEMDVIQRAIAWLIVLPGAVRLTKTPWRDIAPTSPFRYRLLVPLVLFCWSFPVLLGQLTYWAFPKGQSSDAAFPWYLFEVPALLSVLIAAPVMEELFFRGWMLRGFRARYSTRTAIFLSALLFAFAHWGPTQMTVAFLGGLLGASLVIATGSIVPAIVAHIAINSAARLFLLLLRALYGESQVLVIQSMPWPVACVLIVTALVSAAALRRAMLTGPQRRT